MKCCTRLATLLYRVVSCCMKFDSDQIFSLKKCCTIQHFFCFPGCYMMLYSFGHPMQLCCTRVCVVKCEIFYRVVRNDAFVWPRGPLLNTIKQHTTACNKCCRMFYEMLYSFGRDFMHTVVDTIREAIILIYLTSQMKILKCHLRRISCYRKNHSYTRCEYL